MLTVVQNLIRFLLLVLVQVLVLNNIQFLGFVNPYIYILVILLLPVRLPGWISLILAFVLGLSIDVFSNTMGMHAFSTVLVAFIRGGIIKLFTSIEENNNPTPSFYTFNVGAFIKYLIVLVLVHQSTLFFLEAFTFANIWTTILKVLINSFVTILIIMGLMSLKKN